MCLYIVGSLYNLPNFQVIVGINFGNCKCLWEEMLLWLAAILDAPLFLVIMDILKLACLDSFSVRVLSTEMTQDV